MVDNVLASEEDFDLDDPDDIARMLATEHESAEASLKKFHEQGDKALNAFLDERDTDAQPSPTRRSTRWNIFWRNVTTQRALLYGKTPQVEVTRKFGDAKDDIARVAGELQERALNCDIESDGDNYATVIGQCLDDRLIPCLAQARIRYVPKFKTKPAKPAVLHEETGEELAPEVPEQEQLVGEDVEVDYVFWKDFLWTASRTWKEVRKVFFRNEMSRTQILERFSKSLGRLYGEEGGDNAALGESLAKQVPMASSSKERSDNQGNTDARKDDPWQRAEVWEVWDKEKKRVYWWVKGFDRLLDMQDDPLGLKGFWPCPRPMMANVTSSKLVSKPDREMVKDLLDEIDLVSSRITILERAIRVVGVYDKTAGDLGRMVQEGGQNELIPANNWRLFAEKGGIRGQIDWLPLDQIILALDKLREYRTELIAACDQISGMNDIMRGESVEPGVTATAEGIKARFASVRMDALQTELSRFATDLQKLKAEVMSLHFRPETYLAKANAQFTFDNSPQELMQAVQLLKSRFWDYRIEVKSESMAMADYAQMKSERTEFVQALGSFMQSIAPLAQQFPMGLPFFGAMLKWAVSGFRGARTIEGELDRALAQAEQMAQQPRPQAPPDPKVQAQQLKAQNDQMKAQADMQKEQFKLQANLATISAEARAKDFEEQSQAKWNIEEAKGKHAVQNGAGVLPFNPGGAP